MSKRISAAYKTSKPDFDVSTPAAIAKVAKSIVSANEKGTGKGFWVPRYVDRASKILSEEDTPTILAPMNGVPECKEPPKTPVPEGT